MAGNMDSDLLLKFIGYFPDYLSALSRTPLRFLGQPLSKQLYVMKIKYITCHVNGGWKATTYKALNGLAPGYITNLLD